MFWERDSTPTRGGPELARFAGVAVRERLFRSQTDLRPFPREGSVTVMNRAAGTGLMALSVVMAVVGAILTYAVSVTTNGFSIHTVGLILLITGIVLFVVS